MIRIIKLIHGEDYFVRNSDEAAKCGDKKVLTAEELQKQLKISRSTLYRLRKEGLPNKKIGYRTIRYDLVEVLEWLEKKGEK